MKQKLSVVGLSLLLLLVQNSFIFAQTAPPRSTDELVGLLNEPEVVVVVNVKKMLSDIAPALLNKDASLLAKLAQTMKLIEEDTGINPYSLDKIVFGMKLDIAGDNALLIIQTDSSAKLAESLYQSELGKAKLANDVNPLRTKILNVQNRIVVEDMSIGDDQLITAIEGGLDKQINDAKAFESALDALTGTKMNQPLIDAALTDATKIRTRLEAIKTEFKERSTPNEFKARIEALEKQAAKITLGDTNRAAKIAEIEKLVMPLDSETTEFYYKLGELKMMVNDGVAALTQAATFEKVQKSVDNLPTSEAARTPMYRAMRKQLAEMQKNVTALAVEMKPENLTAPPPTLPLKTDLSVESPVYPISTVVTRKDEIFDGKKLSVMTIVKKYGGDREDAVSTNAMFQIDDKTLMSGSRESLIAALGNKSADRSKIARELIAKSGDALVAFGVDLKTFDLKDFGAMFGAQKTAWQVFGALSSAGNDLTLEAIVEKTDRPLVLAAKTATEEKPKTNELPVVGDNDAVTEMLDLLVKSVVGIEGRFTLRFEKKKAVALLGETPGLLRRWTAGKQTSTGKTK